MSSISAFTRKANGIVNAIESYVKVSAHKELFPSTKEIEFNAIWDTGATNTAISNRVVRECNLIPTGVATSNTANGQATVNTYMIDLVLPNNVTIKRVIASEFTAVEGSDLLIGMDVITLGDFSISNYNGKTTFSFRIPSTSETDYVKLLKSMDTVHNVGKIGRNDPCPCGSGNKYKNCCGRNK